MNKTKWLIVFFGIFACIGYFREFFFVFLNIIMFEKYYHSVSAVPVPDIMRIFDRFSYDTLYFSKYFFTLAWALLFFAVNYFAVKKLTGYPFLGKILVYSFCALLTLSVISMAYGFFVNGRLQDDEYTLSRWLMGIAQSPIICLILVASEKLHNKSFRS